MNIAIILSGGIGSRMGLNLPKQYVKVHGKMIISYCLSTFLQNENIDALVIGCANEWKQQIQDEIDKLPYACSKVIKFAQPGETRQYSIFNALKVACQIEFDDNTIVIIHDAARPLVSDALIDHCLDACKYTDAVMPVIPVKDTTYVSEDGIHIKALLNRSQLWSGQAPEAFKLKKYFQVHEIMSREEILKINGSTELAFKARLDCQMIEGDPMNFKITTPEDLASFEKIKSNKQ